MRIVPFPFALGRALLAVVGLLVASTAAAASWQVTSYGDDPNDVATLQRSDHHDSTKRIPRSDLSLEWRHSDVRPEST